MPNPNRVYTEKEIAALLERTAQLQAEDAGSAGSSQKGLNLSELEMVAQDAGLDMEFLHRAALEMELSSSSELGKDKTKTHVRVRRVIPSDLSDDEWEEVIFALRRKFESQSMDMAGMGSLGKGIVEQIGKSREWRHTSMSGIQTSVLFRPHKKGTSMELSQRVGIGSTTAESISYGTIAAGFFAMIAGALAKSLVIGLASVAAMMALFIPLIYYLDTKWRDKKHRELAELGDTLEMLVRAGDEQVPVAAQERVEPVATPVAVPQPSVASSEQEGRIQLDESDAPVSEGPSQAGRDRVN